MSQENVEIVRRSNAAFNRGEVDAALKFFAPDAELVDLANAPDQGSVVKGIDAIGEAWNCGPPRSMSCAPTLRIRSTQVTSSSAPSIGTG